MSDKIPYVRCYEEHGIIETENNTYSIGYEICRPLEQVKAQFNIQLVRNSMEIILRENALEGMSFQFCVRNRRVDTQDYLKGILVSEQGEEKLDSYICAYNETIKGNTFIGHNNFETKVYFILSYRIETVEEAIEKFQRLDVSIKEQFSKMYGYIATSMSLKERLESVFDIYHPENKENFGTVVDYDGTGFSFHSMQLMKLTTKDLVAPRFYDDSESSYLKVGNIYARGLFINSIPINVPDTVLIDIMSVSSNSVLSVACEPIESEIGFSASLKEVKENTYTKIVPIRDTVEDRKARRTQVKEYPIKESEQTYFHQASLELFKDSVAKGNPTMLTSFVIVLFLFF